jgi:hypothetical protein
MQIFNFGGKIMTTMSMTRSDTGSTIPIRRITPEVTPITPAKSWNGQNVVTAHDQLLALRDRLPTFHREPFIINGITNPNQDIIVEDDTDYPITVVSKSYGLMQHDTVFDRVMDGISKLGFDLHGLHAEMSLTQHGERLKISITIPGYDFDPGDGCPLILRINMLNSVDKTTSVAVELEWLRLICGNGMMSGIDTTGFRKAHFRGIDGNDIAEYLTVSLQNVPQDRQLMQQWLDHSIKPSRALNWIDNDVAQVWGEPTASRVWHILRYGEDARPDIIRGKDGEVPIKYLAHERPVSSLGAVPGAFAPVSNAYHIAQALSWVAKEQSNLGTRLMRIKEIPTLMNHLLAN